MRRPLLAPVPVHSTGGARPDPFSLTAVRLGRQLPLERTRTSMRHPVALSRIGGAQA